MKTYRVRVILDEEYDRIRANNPDDAFIIASDYAMDGGDWQYEVEEIEDDDGDDE